MPRTRREAVEELADAAYGFGAGPAGRGATPGQGDPGPDDGAAPVGVMGWRSKPPRPAGRAWPVGCQSVEGRQGRAPPETAIAAVAARMTMPTGAAERRGRQAIGHGAASRNVRAIVWPPQLDHSP